ncbi:MAG: N-acetylmuramic acid 6-phosphate etherase [Bacteroidetes bacterium]|nr:N-acetylmuramic acid 6-phosphate etherase [Bacteroidota bacterium]MDA1120392.1 N-acetylmuramic acid 6-phosphate etherase [Bacteroidota bacterium]
MNYTESASNYNDLEKMTTRELLSGLNHEDQSVALAVEKSIPQIEVLINEITEKMKNGGRLFYIGAGTSGRLGILDASEIPPTYGVTADHVIGIMAGGDVAIRKSVEDAEDDPNQAWIDLVGHNISENDALVGIAASGRTPYVIGGIKMARSKGILTGCITCNSDTILAAESEYPVEIIVGPEFVTGSTRMKSGTAQKLALNMISTAVMIKLGRVKGNKMVDMQLSNSKLVNRGIRIVMDELSVDENTAKHLLDKNGSVRAAINNSSNA